MSKWTTFFGIVFIAFSSMCRADTIDSFLLFGDANNPSNKFYEIMGAEKLFAKNGDFHGGYGWKKIEKLLSICDNE